jgi:integrase
MYADSTIVQYCSSVKEALTRKFPKAFGDDEQWYSGPQGLRTSSENGLKRRKMLGADDFGAATCVLLYRKHSTILGRTHDPTKGAIYLQQINACFLRSAKREAFENALLNAIALNAASRGSEPRSLHYYDWQWDIHLEALETKWKESKTLKTYILLFCNDAAFVETDVLFLFGAYWALEDGLFRHMRRGFDSGQELAHFLKFVFPTLQKHNLSWTAKRITENLREFVPSTMKLSVSSRSTRKAATTQLSIHRQMTAPAIIARTGHSSGTSTDTYTVLTIAASLPGMKCLAGWPDI